MLLETQQVPILVSSICENVATGPLVVVSSTIKSRNPKHGLLN